MIPQPATPPAQPAGDLVDKALPFLSVLTMAMTVPQVWTIWVEHNVGGVSALSWGTYLLASCVWLVHGLRQKDPKMWMACVGWVVLDAAVVAGVLVYR
jgi:uncharacterized protein with PQ loop repeat